MAPVRQAPKNRRKKDKPKITVPACDLAKRLYLRLSQKIVEPMDIQMMHPLIRRVVLPRQNSRFCFLEFDSEDDAKKACSDIEKEKKDPQLVVRPAGMKEIRQKPLRSFLLHPMKKRNN